MSANLTEPNFRKSPNFTNASYFLTHSNLAFYLFIFFDQIRGFWVLTKIEEGRGEGGLALEYSDPRLAQGRRLAEVRLGSGTPPQVIVREQKRLWHHIT